ncbi:hypothetical protein DRQ07_04830 [candidate division KSB1 bacterium]|nr:MAG: hypothetical protein DRQ07_04830 [candidate division KSB1 bacterium]
MDKKLIIIPALTVFVVFLWFMAVFSPLKKQGSELKNKIDVLLQRERAKISDKELEAVRVLVDSLEKRIERGERKFIPEENLLDFGRGIEKILGNYNISLVSITPNYPSLAIFKDNASAVVELPIRLEMQGRFLSFAKFLDNVPDLPFILRTTEVTIKVEEKTSKAVTIILQGVIVLTKERKNNDISDKKNIDKRA